jgi:hypothetical protein
MDFPMYPTHHFTDSVDILYGRLLLKAVRQFWISGIFIHTTLHKAINGMLQVAHKNSADFAEIQYGKHTLIYIQ